MGSSAAAKVVPTGVRCDGSDISLEDWRRVSGDWMDVLQRQAVIKPT
jgi:hypothetical protein